eukprot:c10096_g1_i3.p1 GENE.c10096_g1_i3~~c10096_g1_i3.p1  ORF type:complete len:285 (+),score=82.74 c10096_g1_i3:943-1797(+)
MTFKELFFFYFIAVYVIVTTTSALNVLLRSLSTPLQVIQAMGKAVPSAASFLLQLIIVKLFVGLPMELVRPMELLKVVKGYAMLQDNPVERVVSRRHPNFDRVYAELLLLLTICMCYEVIAPALVLPAGLLYFGFAYLVLKYQVLFVTSPTFETGGSLWLAVLPRVLLALVSAHVLLFAHLLSANHYLQSAMIFPLPWIVQMFHTNVLKKFIESSKTISLEHARSIDTAAQASVPTADGEPGVTHQSLIIDQFNSHAYQQPALFVAPPDIVTPDILAPDIPPPE